mmetsp:Transcript_978/g.2461  ORF Transcript_978/g.2461 Transcript_978/m.2461 type:complete len:281 (-) Transcript_978:3013-3855(-)
MGYGLPPSFRQSAKTAAKQFQQVLSDVAQQECELAWFQGRKEAMMCVARRMMESGEDRTSISTITKLSLHEIQQIYGHGKAGVEDPSTLRHPSAERESGHLPAATSRAAFHGLSSQSRLGSPASAGGDRSSEPKRVSEIDGAGHWQGQDDSSSTAILGSCPPKITEAIGTESGPEKEIVPKEDLESHHLAFHGTDQSQLLNGEADQVNRSLQGMSLNMSMYTEDGSRRGAQSVPFVVSCSMPARLLRRVSTNTRVCGRHVGESTLGGRTDSINLWQCFSC